MRLLSGGIWRLRNVFLLPTVIRPAKSHKHKELCFGSGLRLLLRLREAETQRGRDGGLKGEKAEIGGKEKARKERVPALPPVSISDPSNLLFILSLHPVPSPPSQQLASRERPLWWCTLRHQYVFKLRTESLSKLSVNSRLLPSLLLSHLPYFLPSPSFSPHFLSYSSCHSCLPSPWTVYPVQF